MRLSFTKIMLEELLKVCNENEAVFVGFDVKRVVFDEKYGIIIEEVKPEKQTIKCGIIDKLDSLAIKTIQEAKEEKKKAGETMKEVITDIDKIDGVSGNDDKGTETTDARTSEKPKLTVLEEDDTIKKPECPHNCVNPDVLSCPARKRERFKSIKVCNFRHTFTCRFKIDEDKPNEENGK